MLPSPAVEPQALRTLIAADDIRARVQALAAAIDRDHPDGVHLVCVLNGAFVFLADLARCLTVRVTIDFIVVSSYRNAKSSSGEVQLLKDLDSAIAGLDVVVVEDIVDSGLTLTYLLGLLRARAPRSLRTACLLSKPSRRRIAVPVEYVGFEIEDRFVVGYGLDQAGAYRNLPGIAVAD